MRVARDVLALVGGLRPGSVGPFPAVANGLVYVGRDDGKLYAFDAGIGCEVDRHRHRQLEAPSPRTGVVYLDSRTKLYAFDAAGTTSCSGTYPRKTCTSLWSTTTGGDALSSPTVANGMVYIGRDDGKLQAFGLPPA